MSPRDIQHSRGHHSRYRQSLGSALVEAELTKIQGTSHLVTPASLASPPSLALLPAPVVHYLPLLEDLELLPLVQHVAVVVHIRYKTP